MLGFSKFKTTTKEQFISNLYTNYERPLFDSKNKLRNVLYYNEEKDLYSILLLYPNKIKNFSDRKDNTFEISREGIKEYLSNFENTFDSFKNRLETQFISDEYQFYDFYLSFDFNFNKIKLKEFGIKDLLDFYPLGNHKYIDKLEYMFKIEELRKNVDDSLLLFHNIALFLHYIFYSKKKNLNYIKNIYCIQYI